MRAMEGRVREASSAMHPVLPCGYFDLMEAVIPGTLRMGIDMCINEYLTMVPDIFLVEGFVFGNRPAMLIKVVVSNDLTLNLSKEQSNGWSTGTFNETNDCAIWQACRAT
ncbi:MAG: hypothetical protein M1840_009132 [Geoglossum simile]|nr:MAG: hypothetical protein M1840_009132 [Geoglossum simile]